VKFGRQPPARAGEVLDGVSRAALDPGLVAFGSTLRLVADEDRLPERDLLASARLTPPT